MRAVVQRVSSARVEVEGRLAGEIGRGLLVLLGVAEDDRESEADYLAVKVAGLRIFEDEAGKMNRSVEEVGGGVLVVSQFTLLGDCRAGRRPSFTGAARPEKAGALYRRFVERIRARGLLVATGVFGARMAIGMVGDGPVTLLLDSRKAF
jgi:D-tyrosyl-tRNA(Tyr) deacylase